ncbi:MAG: DUF2063 domain-containing protein [Gammaproteobacteria bacterium]|nr:MAG: DUF2063 domain-containing protein [Gammaproteobacteria bacterium]RTZ73434.1 MAG: DUF2063 domain-containing protein [Gammaproteobacteria bacterium]RTZ81694.1 MAG: DUF2063 domain-containing protein [Gammaproteobacteria bacterium]
MSRSTLPELQRAFARYLRLRDGEATGLILGDERADAQERLDLYAGAYVTRLVEALENHYAGLWGLVGDEQFWQLCRQYIAANPSSFASIREFGHGLAEFLAATEPYSDYPQLAEMAAFEWAQGRVFDAADSVALGEADLRQVPPERWGGLRFTFAPAMQRLDLYWNVPQVWLALDREETPPEASRQEVLVTWLVWRQELDPRWRSLEVDEAWALEHALAGGDFATLCEGLLEWVDARHAPLRAAGFLRTWLGHGLIAGIDA